MVVAESASVVELERSAGLTIELMVGLLIGPISCGTRAPATDAAILRP